MSIVIGAVCGAFAILWQYTPYLDRQWICFLMLVVFFAGGGVKKDYPNYLVTGAASIIWGQIVVFVCAKMAAFGANPILISIVGVGVLTAIPCYIHLVLLQNTLLDKVPMVFCGVALSAQQGGQDPLGLAICMLAGLTIAVLSVVLTDLWCPPPKTTA